MYACGGVVSLPEAYNISNNNNNNLPVWVPLAHSLESSRYKALIFAGITTHSEVIQYLILF